MHKYDRAGNFDLCVHLLAFASCRNLNVLNKLAQHAALLGVRLFGSAFLFCTTVRCGVGDTTCVQKKYATIGSKIPANVICMFPIR